MDRFLQPSANTLLMMTHTTPKRNLNMNDDDQGNLSVENEARSLESLNPFDKYFDEQDNENDIVDLR